MRKLNVFLVLLALIFLSTTTQAGIEKGPYLIYEGTNTEMTVLWQLDATTTCTLEWGLDTNYSTGDVQTTEYGTDHQHKHVITNLSVGTKYFYRVTEGSNTYTGSFRTAPAASATAVKLFAWGDSRSQPAKMDEVAAQMISTYTSDPAFQTIALHSGDWSNSNSESSWASEFFSRESNSTELLADVPQAGCIGNHEGGGSVYRKYYPYPYESNHYFSFDYGPVHVVVIDVHQAGGYSAGSDQYNWLVNDLENTSKPWKIAVFHTPAWSAYGYHSNNTTAQTHLQPLFVEYNVPVIICGHNHYYARCLVDGIHHITAGGAGAPLYNGSSREPYVVEYAKTYHHCEIDIDGNTLSFTAIGSKKGETIDSFQIVGDTDMTPPSPDPMTWAAVPYATSDSSISMTATTATDTENGVEYKFNCTAGGGNDSAWQTGTSYEDTGLTPETQYTYTVTARDTSGNHNTTAPSTAESATTDADIYPPSPDPMTWASVPAPASSGDLLVYEPFNYTAGPISGLTVNGTGLTGTWSASHTGTEARVSGYSLGYSTLPVTGGCFTGSLHANAWCQAAIDTSVLTGHLDDSDELWFSFVGDTIATVVENQIRLQFGSDSSNHVGIYMGNTSASAGQVKAMIKVGGSESLSSGSASYTNDPRLVVGRVIFGATDTVEVYLPGPDLVKPENPAGTITGSLNQSTFDMVRIQYAHGNTLNSDEIRIGTTYDDVIGQDAPGGPSDAITMTATTATDPSGVEYYFDETSGNPGGSDSGWQDDDKYTDIGLTENTQYTYTVTARDKSSAQNATAASTAKSATTEPSGGDTTPPDPDPMTWATVPYATGQTSIEMVATTATDSSGVEYYFTCTAGGGNDSGWQDQTNYEDTGLSPSTQYTYTVTARDKSTNQNATAASTAESATTDGCTATDMHIESVVCSEAACGGPNKNGVATVTIYDDCGAPVSGALVDVTFTGDFSETIYDVATNGSGVAVITTTGCVKKPSFTATVIDVTDTLPYDSNDDVTDNCSS